MGKVIEKVTCASRRKYREVKGVPDGSVHWYTGPGVACHYGAITVLLWDHRLSGTQPMDPSCEKDTWLG